MTSDAFSRESLLMSGTPEQRVVIAFSMLDAARLEPEIRDLFTGHLDWPWIVMQAMHHRTLALQWETMKRLDIVRNSIQSGMPKNWIAYAEQLSRASLKRNRLWLDCLEKVFEAFNVAGIHLACIKGGALIGDIYTPLTRMLGDIDCLARNQDRAAVRDLLYRMGYQHGMIDPVANTITPISREKYLFWQMHAHIMPKFTLLLDDEDCPFFRFAVGFDFFDPSDEHSYPSDPVIARRVPKEGGSAVFIPDDVDTLINLCSHIYREATSATLGYAGDNWNLWKFCDFRTKLLQLDPGTVGAELAKRLKDSGLEKPFFHALHFTDRIYGDPRLKPWRELCPAIEDTAFLHELADGDRRVRYDRPFADQLFETGRVELPGIKPVWASVMGDGEWW